MKLVYVTSNDVKFKIASSVLEPAGVQLIQSTINPPEIQSTCVEEIAQFTSEWARDRLNCSVVVSDVGFYIHALNGFPGPFVKYVNGWLTAEDVFRLLEGKQDRTVQIKECLAYCEIGREPVLFQRTIQGLIVNEINSVKGSIMDRLVIPECCDHTLSELPNDQIVPFWSKHSAFHHLKAWIND